MKKIITAFLLSTSTTVISQSSVNADAGLPKQNSTTSKFIVEEYRLISAKGDTLYPVQQYPGQLFNKILPPILEKRKKWRETGSYPKYSEDEKNAWMNKQLEPLEYKFVKSTEPSRSDLDLYDFYHDDSLIVKTISYIHCFAVDEKNKKFVFTALQPLKRGTWSEQCILIVNGEIKPWGESYFCCQKLLNGSFMWIYPKVIRPNGNYEYAIMRDEEEIYSFYVQETVPGAIKLFFLKGEDWILEYENNVVINGENLGREKGYSEVFHYQYIKDKLFYFLKKNGGIYMSYNNKVLPYKYDKVPHYGECCTPDIQGNKNMVWFYALKDGYWYYVETGVFE